MMSWTYKGKSLSQLVLSWSLEDVLNSDLYRNEVRRIPDTFASLASYMSAFIFPLLEETRADLFSSLIAVSSAPKCEIVSIVPAKDHKPPNDLFYNIEIKYGNNVEGYEPEIGDLIALSDVKPKCINDLNMPEGSYCVALVQRVRNRWRDDDYDEILILSSKPIEFVDRMQETDSENALYATFLMNMITNIRIWKALNSELEGMNTDILNKVLQTDSNAGENCVQCYSTEKYYIDASTLGATIRSFNLNDSQEEAVLACLAARECHHQNLIKLIWGPPGTGKTNTVASLLFALLKRKCRTVTCTPTNVAVLEVATRLRRLVNKSLEYETYGLGDIVLLGNKERMRIDEHDDLLDIFLDYRVDVLVKCFAPLSGWKHYLESMIFLLEDPERQYHEYLRYLKSGNKQDKERIMILNEYRQSYENIEQSHSNKSHERSYGVWKGIISRTLEESKRKWKEELHRQKENQPKVDKEVDNIYRPEIFQTEKLQFQEFVKLRFDVIKRQLSGCIMNMCTHMPNCAISLRVVKKMFESLDLLEKVALLLPVTAITNEGLNQPLSAFDHEGLHSKLNMAKEQSLEMLRSLRDGFNVPNSFDKRSIRNYCLRNARLLFCTASSAAKLHSEEVTRFEMVVIDEAAMLKECESTIPLLLPGLRHVVLIGDERQLPAMVKSKLSEKSRYGRSLFERLVLLGHKKHLLNVQYRMHPSISLFPNEEFYGKLILDAPNVKGKSYEKCFLQGDMYSSYSFINVTYGEDESDDGHSHKNMVEVAVVSKIVANLFEESFPSNRRLNVGIISPYNAQVSAIKEKLEKRCSIGAGYTGVSVNVRSIDGFQGGEEDIIIISTVRSNMMGTVGFLCNPQRTNVALTRARYSLWIVGNGATLINSDSVWGRLVDDTKARGCFHNADEDNRLAEAMVDSLVEFGQLEYLLHMDSLLFKRARWKVCFSDGLFNALVRISNVEIQKEVLSLLRKLSLGWRPLSTERNSGVINGLTWWLEVNKELHLIWSVDVIVENSKYMQFLKVWNLLPSSEIPRVAMQLEIFYSQKCVDIVSRCKFRCTEGNIEIPMTWPVEQKDDPIRTLSDQFASLSLRDEAEVLSSSCSYQRWWSLGIWSKVPRLSAHHTS